MLPNHKMYLQILLRCIYIHSCKPLDTFIHKRKVYLHTAIRYFLRYFRISLIIFSQSIRYTLDTTKMLQLCLKSISFKHLFITVSTIYKSIFTRGYYKIPLQITLQSLVQNTPQRKPQQVLQSPYTLLLILHYYRSYCNHYTSYSVFQRY